MKLVEGEMQLMLSVKQNSETASMKQRVENEAH